jgi:GTP-binding protein
VNKWDLVEKETNTARQYEIAIEKNLGLYDFLPVIFVSALTKQRITKVIDTAKEVHLQQSRRISTSALNKSIMLDIEITPPKSSTSREIKIKFVTQIKTNPPMFAFFCNHPKLVQESYKRFLMNKLREHFGFAGVPLGIVFKEK